LLFGTFLMWQLWDSTPNAGISDIAVFLLV